MLVRHKVFPFILLLIFALASESDASIIGFEAESGALGAEFDPAQADAGALGEAYITTETDNGSSSTKPGTDAFTVSYSLAVPAGTYDVYIRGRIGSGGSTDDSFYYANSFGDADPAVEGDWQTENGIGGKGIPTGSFGWSSNLTATVTSSGGTVQWEIGAREDGFDIDAFALVTTGQSVTDEELDNAVVVPYILLSASSVSSNAPPGSLIGNLSMVSTNGSFAYSLDTSTGDYNYFDIASGTTNLRTAAWIDASTYSIDIIATEQGGGGLVLTNDFEITVNTVDDRPTFVVSADVQSGAADGTLIGTARTMESGATFSLGSGREDLFYLDGEHLKVTNTADWGSVGTTNYIMLRAVVGSGTNELIIAAGVVSGATSGTVFTFR